MVMLKLMKFAGNVHFTLANIDRTRIFGGGSCPMTILSKV